MASEMQEIEKSHWEKGNPFGSITTLEYNKQRARPLGHRNTETPIKVPVYTPPSRLSTRVKAA